MALMDTAVAAATYPVRLGMAFSRTTLQLGRLVAPDGPMLRPGGYAERMAALRDLTAPERPLGKAIAEGGTLDRLLASEGPVARLLGREGALERLVEEGGVVDRVLGPGGTLDQLVLEGGALERLLATGGALDRLTAPGGLLETLLAPGGLGDRLLADDGYAEKLLADGGTLDQLVALGVTLEGIQPRLNELSMMIPVLHEAVEALEQAVGPLGEVAARLPINRRKTSTRAVTSG